MDCVEIKCPDKGIFEAVKNLLYENRDQVYVRVSNSEQWLFSVQSLPLSLYVQFKKLGAILKPDLAYAMEHLEELGVILPGIYKDSEIGHEFLLFDAGTDPLTNERLVIMRRLNRSRSSVEGLDYLLSCMFDPNSILKLSFVRKP